MREDNTEPNPNCEVHYYLMPDGRCSCKTTCRDCGTTYTGHDHSGKDCIASLRAQLDEIKNKV